jgi:uncharacterized NAD(P)/FAD-binding protein YdhS
MDIRRSGNPLLDALLADGAASHDPLALGLRTSADGALIDSDGHADGRLHTLGALRRGELWETTAVEEIRAQAERLSHTIGRSFDSHANLPEEPARGDEQSAVDASVEPLSRSDLHPAGALR